MVLENEVFQSIITPSLHNAFIIERRFSQYSPVELIMAEEMLSLQRDMP